MVKGIVINDWDEDEGLQNKLVIPETLSVEIDDMMRVFYAHITGNAEAGNVVVRLSKIKSNVASYFTGFNVKRPYMINLILDISEDPEIFGEMVLDSVNAKCVDFLEKMYGLAHESEKYQNLLKNLTEFLTTTIEELAELINMTKEQRFARIYSSTKSRVILEALRERPLTRIEIQGIVEEKTGQPLFNVDAVLDPFIKTEIVNQDWLTGENSIYLFLIRDFEIFRKPNSGLLKLAKNKKYAHFGKIYEEKVREIFLTYEFGTDRQELALILLNPMKYSILESLRKEFLTVNDLKSKIKRNIQHLDQMLEEMVEDNLILIQEDEAKNKWVLLVSDITCKDFYPEFLVDNVAKNYNSDEILPELAVKQLELLERNYR